jgi:hypothetical protein
MKTSNGKTRSDKFPLTLHPTGQYCKKIRGKIYYFGSDRKQSLQTYLEQATFLHGYDNNLQKPTKRSKEQWLSINRRCLRTSLKAQVLKRHVRILLPVSYALC